MAAKSTSFRISDKAKDLLARCARLEGLSATSLLEQLIVEGVRQRRYEGIVFRGSAHDRRAALANGPDVWEITQRLRELDGPLEDRLIDLQEETGIRPRWARIAVDYAAEYSDEIEDLIEENERAIEKSQNLVQRREALFS